MNATIETVFREFVAYREAAAAPATAAASAAVSVDDVHFEREDDVPGAGLMSQIMFGRIAYRVGDRRRTTDSLAIKSTAFDGEHFASHYCAMQMDNELHFFGRVMPLLRRAAAAGGDHVDALFAPFLFGYARTTADGHRAVAIYANLHRRGYANCSSTVFLDYAHLALIMRRLGRLHAYSYAAARVDAKRFQFLTQFVPRIHERFVGMLANYNRPIMRKYVRMLRECPSYASKSAALRQMVDRFDETVSHLNEPTTTTTAAVVVCHGDCTGANVVFRYEDGRPVDVKMLDLGMWRVASPTLDLAHVLYVEADQNTRNERWYDLLDDYRAGLADIMAADDVPSNADVQSQFRDNCFHAAMVASYFVPRKFAAAQKSPLLFEAVLANHPTVESFGRHGAEDAIAQLVESVEEGGAAATEAVLNVMRDMMDREFI